MKKSKKNKKMAFEMNKKQVIKVPKEAILDAIVIDVKKTTWRSIISPEKLTKFENPDDIIIQVMYECEHEGNHIKGEDVFKFYENPMANSKLGRFLEKYEDLKVGVTIKVDFDKDGFSSIRIN